MVCLLIVVTVDSDLDLIAIELTFEDREMSLYVSNTLGKLLVFALVLILSYIIPIQTVLYYGTNCV
jgi:hypothetical protein